MTSRTFYLVSLVVFLSGLLAIVLFPSEALGILTLAVPVAVVGATGATFYLGRIYRRQPLPRSRFFKMVLETFVGLILIGGWVAYLSVARILQRDDGIIIPAPPPSTSAPISALLVVVVFSGLIRFAVEVYVVRRRSDHRAEDEDVSNHKE